MAHWQHRAEPAWKNFEFNQPYAKGLKRLKEEVLAKTDFDPATLWQWGTMQAMALIEVLKTCERLFGERGPAGRLRVAARASASTSAGRSWRHPKPEGHEPRPSSLASTPRVINRIAYASLEAPHIDGADRVTFDIVWCPHQDHYGAFDCRVQRYFVQGMIDAAREFGARSASTCASTPPSPPAPRRATSRCGRFPIPSPKPPGKTTPPPSTPRRSRSPSARRRKIRRSLAGGYSSTAGSDGC